VPRKGVAAVSIAERWICVIGEMDVTDYGAAQGWIYAHGLNDGLSVEQTLIRFGASICHI
jgi:hypothetical protein